MLVKFKFCATYAAALFVLAGCGGGDANRVDPNKALNQLTQAEVMATCAEHIRQDEALGGGAGACIGDGIRAAISGPGGPLVCGLMPATCVSSCQQEVDTCVATPGGMEQARARLQMECERRLSGATTCTATVAEYDGCQVEELQALMGGLTCNSLNNPMQLLDVFTGNVGPACTAVHQKCPGLIVL